MPTGDWFIERKMHDGTWETVLAGYDTEKQARAGAARQAKSSIFTSRWRVGCDAGTGVTALLEAEFAPGKRVKWTPVAVAPPQPEHKASADCWCEPVAYVQRMGSYQGVPAYGCLLTIEAEQRMKVNDALYGQLELDQAVAAERERLHNLLRLVADEPNIDKARALADAELHGPNVRAEPPA